MEDADFRRTNSRSEGKSDGGSVKEEARQTFEDVKRETAAQAKETGEYVREQAENSLESGKSKLSSQVGSVSRALRRGSESFREDGQQELAEQTARLGERVDSVRSLIEDYGAEGVYHEVKHLAKRRPFWLVGGAAVVGIAAAAVMSGRGGMGPRGRRRR